MAGPVSYGQVMAMTADQLPDDPDALKAMVLARDVENARLIQIIKELQRHRFGRRAETLPEDQLLLGLEEVEQTEAGDAPRSWFLELLEPEEETQEEICEEMMLTETQFRLLKSRAKARFGELGKRKLQQKMLVPFFSRASAG